MRLRSLNLWGAAIVLVAGCGPSGPGNLEGFGDVGETEGPTPTTVGPGDGDGDPTGDGDGDGDGDGECLAFELGGQSDAYFEGFLEPNTTSYHDGLCEPAPGPDVSLTWTAPVSASYRAESYFSDNPISITVLRGGCDGALESCGGFDWPPSVDFEAVEGQDYTFVVDTFDPGVGGYFDFALYPVDVDPGQCPQGVLQGTNEGVFGSTFGASNDFESQCGGHDAPDHAYLFFPPVSGTYSINMYNSDYDTMLHVFAGECGGPLLDCNDDTFDGLQSEVVVELVAGQVYTLVADGYGNSAGNYELQVQLLDGQGLCDGAEPLLLDVGTIAWPGDIPGPGGDVFSGCSDLPFENRFIWYAPADGLYRVTQASGLEPSSVAVVADGCAGGPPLCGPVDVESSVEFDALAGQEIVFIAEWSPGPVDVELTIESVGGGDPGCGEALPMGVPTQASGNTLGSGNDSSGTCSSGPAPEVEYWWTAPQTGTYRITTEGSNYDTLIYVRDGGCDGPELACNDDTFTDIDVFLYSTIEIELLAGQTISIFVDGYNGSGAYDLTITQI